MPRKADVSCAGSCGRLIWSSRTSLPPGQAMCRPCRAVKAKRGVCSACGSTFDASGDMRYRRTCSGNCAKAKVSEAIRLSSHGRVARLLKPWMRSCLDCSASTSRRGYIPLCLPCAKARRSAQYRRKSAVRRGAAAMGTSLTIERLGERDGWRCHLCRRKVDPNLRAPHPRSRSFDHLTPVSLGGTDEPANLRLAHLRCNISRGNRGTVQLLLIG
jgi:5-methylcytosine-specific restriction endonuclease McrA